MFSSLKKTKQNKKKDNFGKHYLSDTEFDVLMHFGFRTTVTSTVEWYSMYWDYVLVIFLLSAHFSKWHILANNDYFKELHINIHSKNWLMFCNIVNAHDEQLICANLWRCPTLDSLIKRPVDCSGSTLPRIWESKRSEGVGFQVLQRGSGNSQN